MVEKRFATRHRVLKAGRIEFSGSVIDCTIRNVSDAWAALDVGGPMGIPASLLIGAVKSRPQGRSLFQNS
jgi:hypothetical protein